MDLANRGDVEGLAALTAPDVACFPADDQPESAPFRGREALVRYAQGWLDVFDEYTIEPREFIDLGEQVVAVGVVVARGRGSGAETSDEDAWLFRFKDGKAIEYRECGTKQQALDAAGKAGSR